jgi:hypothetical protein
MEFTFQVARRTTPEPRTPLRTAAGEEERTITSVRVTCAFPGYGEPVAARNEWDHGRDDHALDVAALGVAAVDVAAVDAPNRPDPAMTGAAGRVRS